MRRRLKIVSASVLFAAGLVTVAPITAALHGLPGDRLVRAAVAQSIAEEAAVEQAVRVRGAASSRINVRAAPVVADGNVVAQLRGGQVLRVLGEEPRGGFTWVRIATLPDAPAAVEGWIRGDLLEPARLPDALPAVGDAPPRPAPLEIPAVARPPLEQRTDWSRQLRALYPAIEGCVTTGSAPPMTVLRATSRSRGLAEIIMSDAAGRRWDCVIRATGGTPIRYDPLSGAVFHRDRIAQEPHFSPQEERPMLDPDCHSFERIDDPATGAFLGWLTYRTCP